MPLLCVASPKGGVGKTTIAANVAHELAQAGARVVALDLDPQNALRLHFGVALDDGMGVMPILRQRGHWQSALRSTRSGVRLLPYGRVDMGTALAVSGSTGHETRTVVDAIREIAADPATILIVDTPPGPSTTLAAILPVTDFLLTVLLADAASIALIPAVEQGLAYGQSAPQASHGYVLNQVNPLSRLSRAICEAARLHLGDQILGLVRRDENVAEAIASQQPVSVFSPASRAAHDIADLSRAIGSRAPARPPFAVGAAYQGRGNIGAFS